MNPVWKRIFKSLPAGVLWYAAVTGSPAADMAVIQYSTFLGGALADESWGVTVDGEGAAYLTGSTHSQDFPTRVPYQPSYAATRDVFIAKIGSEGDSLLFSTYLGGTLEDGGFSVVLDPAGAPCVIGYTVSADFPTRQAFQGLKGGGSYDAFVSKLCSCGSDLIFSSYLGGGGDDIGHGIAVDSLGRFYLAGATTSADFPTVQPYQSSYAGGTDDGFVSLLDSSGSFLLYSTFLGGSAADFLYDIAVDGRLNYFAAGHTASIDYPTRNCYQASQADAGISLDAVITRFTSDGSGLVFSSYLGGSDRDSCARATGDSEGNAYLTGFSWSVDFPTRDAYQASKGSPYNYDAMIAKFDPAGSLLFSTYLGGGDRDEARGIACDSAGAIMITGQTFSFDFPIFKAFQTGHAGGLYSDDAFVSELSSDGRSLIFSTYLGGSSNEIGWAVAFGSSADAYIAGWTSSFDFPTENPYQASWAGDRDVFLSKIMPPWSPTPLPTQALLQRPLLRRPPPVPQLRHRPVLPLRLRP